MQRLGQWLLGLFVISSSLLVAEVQLVRLRLPTGIYDTPTPVPNWAPLPGAARYVAGFMNDPNRKRIVDDYKDSNEEEDMGDLPGRDEQVYSNTLASPIPEIGEQLKTEGWVNDELPLGKEYAWKPEYSRQELYDLAKYNGTIDNTTTVDDGILATLNLTVFDPQESPNQWKQIENFVPSQDDPVSKEAIGYSFGNVNRNRDLVYKNPRGGIVEDDPLKLSQPPIQLALPQGFAITKDITIPTRGEDNSNIGEEVTGFDRIIEDGFHDSATTRSLDPEIPTEKMTSFANAAVDDYNGTPRTESHFGADESLNLDPIPYPMEPQPSPFQENPFREGLERHPFDKIVKK